MLSRTQDFILSWSQIPTLVRWHIDHHCHLLKNVNTNIPLMHDICFSFVVKIYIYTHTHTVCYIYNIFNIELFKYVLLEKTNKQIKHYCYRQPGHNNNTLRLKHQKAITTYLSLSELLFPVKFLVLIGNP